jgi:hypothetical protein
LGIGDWGLGIGDWAQSPIPNPQSPILATFTVVIGMSIGLLCVLLIPIDIFLTTYRSDRIDKLAEMIKLDRSYFQQIMLCKFLDFKF